MNLSFTSKSTKNTNGYAHISFLSHGKHGTEVDGPKGKVKSQKNDFMNEILIRSIHFKSPAEIKEIKEKAAIAAYKFL